MGGASVDWFDLPVDVLVIGTTRLAIRDRTPTSTCRSGALDRLSLADRTLLALHHFEHLSLGEIGAAGVPGSTALEQQPDCAQKNAAIGQADCLPHPVA